MRFEQHFYGLFMRGIFLCPRGSAPLYPEVLFERMAQVVAVEVRIDLGGEDAFMPEHLLYLPDAGAPFEQVRGKRVPERMAG